MKTLFAVAIVALTALPAHAQFGGSIVYDPAMFGQQAQQLVQEVLEAKAAIVNLRAGLAGGYAPDLALIGELQNYVNLRQGLALNLNQIATQYPRLYPGYNAQGGAPATAQMTTTATLGTLRGTMEAAASQMDSLPAEQARLQSLEARNGTAIGNLEAQEVGNEAQIQNAQEAQKMRELLAGLINAQTVAESNRLNEEVYSQQTSLAIKTVPWQGDYTHDAPQPIHLYGRN
jgi:hypothetical protein